MQFYKLTGLLLLSLYLNYHANSQLVRSNPTDTIHSSTNHPKQKDSLAIPYKVSITQNLNVKSFVLPTLMISYGVMAIENPELQDLNLEMKEEVWQEHVHAKFHIDNYLQFAPAIAVYGLNLAGIKGKHNFFDLTMIYGLSNLLVLGTVHTLKNTSGQQRPDGSAYNSFPSGHTAEAFASAEFLYQEYKDISPWYGVVGYAMAAATGYLRLYNNKHWLNDVVAGAGIGIASTKIAYWIYPKMQHLFSNKKPLHTVIVPTYQSGSIGLAMVHNF